MSIGLNQWLEHICFDDMNELLCRSSKLRSNFRCRISLLIVYRLIFPNVDSGGLMEEGKISATII